MENEPLTAPPARALKRIWVVGSCGSGKSTLARELGERLGLESVHIDDYIWLPEWRLRERGEMLAMLEERLSGPRWVMEGNLGRDARRLWAIADRADLIVWLDLPIWLTLWRVARRSLLRSALRRSCCNGNYETFSRAFFSRKSMLLYTWRTRRLRAVIYSKLLRNRRHIRLRTASEVSGFLEALSLARATGWQAREPISSRISREGLGGPA
jgi:adenylate kinase family enzyme